jgi:hypothetical protein
MAVINRNSLVLLGVSVNRDVVTGTMGNGNSAADYKTAGIPFLTRRQSQGFPPFDQEPQQQPPCADDADADGSAARAGRPGSSSRVVAGRIRAMRGIRTSLRAWSPAEAGHCPITRLGHTRLWAWQRPLSGKRSHRRYQASYRRVLASRIPSWLLETRTRKCDEAGLARTCPAEGAPPASTRG